MHNAPGIAPFRENVGQLRCHPAAPIRQGQQQHAPFRRQLAPIERRGDRLAANGWKGERQNGILGHGECGGPEGR